MNTWIPIKYRDFWDVPRIFLTTYQGKLFLFDCAFDDTVEDFHDCYKVYLLPDLGEDVLEGPWANLHALATTCFGEVPVETVHFDPSKRREINSAVLEQLTTPIGGG